MLEQRLLPRSVFASDLKDHPEDEPPDGEAYDGQVTAEAPGPQI